MKKLIIFLVGLLLCLASCDSLVYTTPAYYDYYYHPQTVVVRPLPPPPLPRYIHRPPAANKPKPPVGNYRRRK